MTFMLQGKGKLNQVIFEDLSNGKVTVRGITGLVDYIDNTIPVENARGLWKNLQDAGWYPVHIENWMGNVAFNAHVYS